MNNQDKKAGNRMPFRKNKLAVAGNITQNKLAFVCSGNSNMCLDFLQ